VHPCETGTQPQKGILLKLCPQGIKKRTYQLLYGDRMGDLPRTTPECKRLQDIVIKGLNASILDIEAKEDAQVALKKLRKKRCALSLEYIIQESAKHGIVDTFASKIRKDAREYLNELGNP
jgi:hypothetical protein